MSTLLLVEDNELNADMLRRRLERRGYDVVLASDGEQALAQTRTLRPDLVLMDMSLPKIDGWTATGILKGDTETAGIPVIALTAHALSSDRDKALSVGCDEYDTKPIDLDRLVGKIEALLTRARGV
ncbi:MAG: response regulator [Sandaracinaceae bacterium]